jgi:hypothetical protein
MLSQKKKKKKLPKINCGKVSKRKLKFLETNIGQPKFKGKIEKKKARTQLKKDLKPFRK